MDLGDSSHNTGTNNKKKGLRRVWTKVEQEAMLNILDVIVAKGGRTSNGTFRPGTNLQIERELSKVLPNCDIKASPHIESIMRKWKKQYSVIFDMLNTSGFRWNDVTKCVEVDSDSVWEAYIQSHGKPRKWRNKPFPLYEKLANIFGTDCATGLEAKTPCEMVERVNKEKNDKDDVEVGDDFSPISVTQACNSQHTVRSQSDISSRKRGRSRDDIIVCLKEVATTFRHVFAQSVERMDMLIECILNNKEDRSDIADELASMGLPEDDEFEALTLILEKPSNISAFKSLRDERKLAFVHRLLRKRS